MKTFKGNSAHWNWWHSLGAKERFEYMKEENVKQVNEKLIKRMYQNYIYKAL